MGAGIAAHLAGAGIAVTLMDIVPKELTKEEILKGLTLASESVRNRFALLGKERVANPKNKIKLIYDEDFKELISVGNFEDDLEQLNEFDWIIEAVVENLELKKELFHKVADYRKQSAIVSTNTSGVSVNKIVEGMPLEFRQHFLGTHFFNPVRYMNLFELIPSVDTTEEVIAFMSEFGARRLGKGVVLAKDTANFIGNRIGTFTILNILKNMVKFGYDIPKVDLLTGTVMGRPKSATFRTLDMVGLDTVVHVADNAYHAIEDPTEKEAFLTPDFLNVLVGKNFLGDKAGHGFYKKVEINHESKILTWDIFKEDYVEFESVAIDIVEKASKDPNKYKMLVSGASEESRFAWEVLKSLLLYSAEKIPEIADDYRDIDNAMTWGYNWDLGPFAIWDAIGLEASVERMKEDGESIPAWISERLASGNLKFYDETNVETPYLSLSSPKNKIVRKSNDSVLLDVGDGIACLQFTAKNNILTEDVIQMLSFAAEEVEQNFNGLVIGNHARNFTFGANLKQVLQLISDKEWSYLEDMVDQFQSANMKLKYCKKPVVSAPSGMCFGGGTEISLHATTIVAHAETYMGLVEVGVGLIPGAGGTKEFMIRSVEGLGKMNNGEMIPYIRKGFETIAMAKVSTSGHDAMKLGYMRKSDMVVMSRDYLLEEAKRTALYLWDSGFRPLIKKEINVLGDTGRAALKTVIDFMLKGGFITSYDGYIAERLAYIMTGGNVPCGVTIPEEQALLLEKEAFVALCKETKTCQRIEFTLNTGKPLRN